MRYEIEAKQGGFYDVVVCGGGTAGVCAAIAAAREGMKTLLLERTFTVGGMLTLGEAGITKFTEHCRDAETYKNEVLDVLSENPRKVQVVGGLAHEYCKRMIDAGGALGTHGETGSYVFTDRYAAEVTLVDMLREAGVTVLYDTRVCTVRMDGDTLQAVVVVNKEGFTEYEAKCFIDATGDADVAALSGVEYHVGVSETDLAEGCGRTVGELQGMGTMYRVRGVDYEKMFAYLDENSDRFFMQEFGVMSLESVKESYRRGDSMVFRLLIDHPTDLSAPRQKVQVYNLPEKDEAILLGWGCGTGSVSGLNPLELSQAQDKLLHGALRLTEVMRQYPGFENITVQYIPDVGVRETRHIVGEYTITGMDVVLGRDFEDSVACGGHPVDIHPLPPEVEHMDMNHWRFHIPYRVMVPAKVENLLVAGRPVSATRLASGAIRPTAQCMALGEAAGVAAAICASENRSPRQVDTAVLRRKRLEKGAIL